MINLNLLVFGFSTYESIVRTYKATEQKDITANSVLAKLKANLIENGQRKIRGTRGGWENWSKWVPRYSYDLNASFTMDSVLDNTYKPKSLKDNQFDTNAGYCSINEQDLLNQFKSVHQCEREIIPRYLISDKTNRKHRPSLCFD